LFYAGFDIANIQLFSNLQKLVQKKVDEKTQQLVVTTCDRVGERQGQKQNKVPEL
jgi:hypothetical protein